MVSVAAWIPDAPHGRSGSCKPRKCKLEEPHYSTNTWYFSRKEIEERSPSRRDGICLSIETYLRTLYCGFLQDLGKALKVSQITVATSIMFCHRFFLGQSHAKNDWQTVATACMFLAGKVEDTHVPLKYLSVVSHGIIYKTDPVTAERIKQWEYYIKQKELILLGERILLSTIGFDFNIMHPYKPLTTAIKRLKLEHGELTKVAWNTVNDCLQTTLCLQFKPHYIASGALYLAAKSLNFKLPSSGGKAWWQEFDVSPFQLEEVIKQMFEVLVLSKRPLSLPDTKACSELVPTSNSLDDRKGFSNLCKQSSHLLQNPVGAQVNCESLQKSIARALPCTVASPRRVSDFNTKDGKDGFSSSSDESLNKSLQRVCIEEVKRENMHSSIRPCESVQSQVQRYASTLLEMGIDITKSHEHGLQEEHDINMCRFTEGDGIMAIAGFTGVEERNASEDSVTQPQYSVYDVNRPNQCKPPEALETRSTSTQTCVDVSSQYQDAKQYKIVEGNHVWVREEISCVRECSSSEESLHQFQPPFCFEVRADPMQSSVKVSPGSCMLSDVGHHENVVLENGGGCGTSSENCLQQKQDVNPHRRTEHGATLFGDERASVKREVERFSLNLISDIDKQRMRTALKRRREERATGQFPAVTKVEDSYDSWIEKELEDGIELTPPPMQKARHSHEDFHESWIEKELEGGMELTTQLPKQKARHDDEDIYQSRIENELEDGIELTNQPLKQKALHHDEDFYESWIEKELEDGIELTTQRPPKQKARHDDADFFESWIEKELEDGIELTTQGPPKQKARHDDADFFESWIEKELEDGIELTIRPSNRKRRHDDDVGLL